MSLSMRTFSSVLGTPAARWWVIAIVLVGGIGVSTAGDWVSTRQVLRAGLRVGFRNSPPFYYATPDGQPRGMAVDVLNEAAGRLRAPLRWVRIGDLEPSDKAVGAGTIDAWPTSLINQASPSLYVTDPWLESSYFLVFKKGAGITRPSDVAGRKVALLNGRLEDVLGPSVLPGATLEFVPGSPEKFQRVCDDSVAAAFVDGREGQAYLLDWPRLRARRFRLHPGRRRRVGVRHRHEARAPARRRHAARRDRRHGRGRQPGENPGAVVVHDDH